MKLSKLVTQGRFLFLNALSYAPYDNAVKQQTVRQQLGTLFSPALTRKPKLRLLAGIHLVNKMLPIEPLLEKHLITFDGLPFNFAGRAPQFLASGSGHNVYAVNFDGRPMVLKIGYNSYGMERKKLLERADMMYSRYRTISDWFRAIPGFIPDEQFLVVHGPLRGYPVIGILQPYLDNMRGIFEDYSEAAFVDLLRRDSHLREQFQTVVAVLNAVYDEQGICIDLLGDANLVVVDDNGTDSLRFIDPNKVIVIGEQAPKTRQQYAERMAHLNRLLAASADS